MSMCGQLDVAHVQAREGDRRGARERVLLTRCSRLRLDHHPAAAHKRTKVEESRERGGVDAIRGLLAESGDSLCMYAGAGWGQERHGQVS